MIMKRIVLALSMVSAWGGSALATHKNWTMQNAGGQCYFTSYSTSSPPANDLAIANYDSQSRFAICPVSLAGRWGSSSGPQFVVPRWAAAMSAKALIENNNTTGSVFDCITRARLSTQSIFFSQTAVANTPGQKALYMASSSNWGNTSFENNQSLHVRSMDLDCRITGTTSPNPPSVIKGYQVKICQLSTTCNDGGSPDHEGTPGGVAPWVGDRAFVQTSGLECMPTIPLAGSDVMQRTLSGAKNAGSGYFNVFCPITQPANDSWWHERLIRQTRVYYKNDIGVSGAPLCGLVWYRHTQFSFVTLETDGSNTFTMDGPGFVEQEFPQNDLTLGKDVAVGVWCQIGPGQTIRGVTALMSLTTISGGM
jgi:hypothetical protein